jgi:UDP-glucose 4-epimerase
MEKDDFRYSLSEVAKRCQAEGAVPLLCDARGNPLKRNFVHVEDLAARILAALENPITGNNSTTSAWTSPSTTGAAAAYLKFDLNWRPRGDLACD